MQAPSSKLFSLFLLSLALFLAMPASLSAAPMPVGSLAWVKEKMKVYPELAWLMDTAVQSTQEGKAETFTHSWSKKIKGDHCPEFERTLASFVSFHLILDGSESAYAHFTQIQPASEKLSRQSFKRLHTFAKNVIDGDPERKKAMEINLLLGDMGKTPTAREKAKSHGVAEHDHDLFLDECLKTCPTIFPTFQNLPPRLQTLIKKNNGLAHFGHITHVEGGPEILTKLKQSQALADSAGGFDFQILTHICDVSAARAHEDNRGSKVLTEPTLRAIEAVRDAIHYLATHSEWETLKFYLKIRANWLGFDEETNHWPLFARIGAMLRLNTPEDGKVIQEAYTQLPAHHKTTIAWEFDPLIQRKEQTPTYIPAVFVNLLIAYKKQGATPEAALRTCIREGVPLIGKILGTYRSGKANCPYTPALTLSFNKLAGQLRDSPELTKVSAFSITPEGVVELKI